MPRYDLDRTALQTFLPDQRTKLTDGAISSPLLTDGLGYSQQPAVAPR